MDSSILNTIKKLIGLDVDYTPFDEDIKVFINGAMMVLQQLGVGPKTGFVVSDLTQTWGDFLPSDMMLEGAKQFIYLYVKMAFDPPASSVVMEAMKSQRQELEWRLREQAEFFPGDGSRLGYYEQLAAENNEEEKGSGDRFLQTEAGIVRIVSVREESIEGE